MVARMPSTSHSPDTENPGLSAATARYSVLRNDGAEPSAGVSVHRMP